jgi:hypothetical protein
MVARVTLKQRLVEDGASAVTNVGGALTAVEIHVEKVFVQLGKP